MGLFDKASHFHALASSSSLDQSKDSASSTSQQQSTSSRTRPQNSDVMHELSDALCINLQIMSDVMEHKRVSYITLMKSLTHEEVIHKFKTLVRVVAGYSCQHNDLSLMVAGCHGMKLTLEDPRARIHAYIQKDDVANFFGGSLTVEAITRKMNKLLGITEPKCKLPAAPPFHHHAAALFLAVVVSPRLLDVLAPPPAEAIAPPARSPRARVATPRSQPARSPQACAATPTTRPLSPPSARGSEALQSAAGISRNVAPAGVRACCILRARTCLRPFFCQLVIAFLTRGVRVVAGLNPGKCLPD
ncbi:hypothetical protein GUJ93_ZPchr0006g43072 [Zizania palustris]|uniref:POT1A/B-like OB fold domain-containing protein n=1 Tax=Zizania palustris TaxID=103762 RepID=A0A8J5W2H1_ZIZPA|nr:hypothetical protein GUJ93_ZPchr0006g43072 [Zizania palustris]